MSNEDFNCKNVNHKLSRQSIQVSESKDVIRNDFALLHSITIREKSRVGLGRVKI